MRGPAFCAALLLAAVRALPGELPAVFCDFESAEHLTLFSASAVAPELAAAHATSGTQALRLTFQAGVEDSFDSSWYSFGWGFSHDWSNAVRFEFDCYATEALSVTFQITSGLPRLSYLRTWRTISIPQGQSVVQIQTADIAGDVELRRMFGLRLTAQAAVATELYLDSLRLVFDTDVGSSPRGVRLLWTDDPKTTMTVVWETDLDEGSVVEYGVGSPSTQAGGASAPLPGEPSFPGYVHVVKLTGLTPGTAYSYRCGADPRWSPESSFTTAPADERASFTFTVGGDSKDELGELFQMFQLAAAQNPRFHVFLGDMVPRGAYRFQWDRWFDASEEFARAIPIMPTTGDHEAVGDADHVNYLARYPLDGGADGGRDYVFECGLVSLISLHYDASRPETAVFLQQALTTSAGKWKVVASHWPFVTSTAFDAGGAMAAAFGSLMDSSSLPLVCSGHAHAYERSKPLSLEPAPWQIEPDYSDGNCYVVSGGMGASITAAAGAAWCESFANELHLVRVDVSPGALDVTAIAKDGTVIDAFTITADDDSDGDGLPDDWETEHFGHPDACDPSDDPDLDGLTNAQEFEAGTDPQNADTDGDGVPDGTDGDPRHPPEPLGGGCGACAGLAIVLLAAFIRRKRG